MHAEGESVNELGPEELDSYARTFGKLYNDLLIGTKYCQVRDCKKRRDDGSCGCVDIVKDMVDAVWEAKAGRPERLERIRRELDEEAAEMDSSGSE